MHKTDLSRGKDKRGVEVTGYYYWYLTHDNPKRVRLEAAERELDGQW